MGLRAQLIGFIQAVVYVAFHPFDTFDVTVVRRYADAQGNYIGELYEGHSREARMIGATCDNWPLDADISPLPGFPRLCWRKSFLAPLPHNTLRVGAMHPEDNDAIQAYVGKRRWLPLRVTVLNRFIETILDGHNVR